jgi:flagellar biosynthesis/type III secretory pathway protein FliH
LHLNNWAQFFNAKSQDELTILATKDVIMERAYNNLKRISADDEVRNYISDHEAWKICNDHIIACECEEAFKKGITEGEARGEARGEAKGLARGKAAGLAEGEASGEAKGKIASIFTILSARGLSLSPAQKESISSCNDLALLENYLQKALTATSTADLFADTAK